MKRKKFAKFADFFIKSQTLIANINNRGLKYSPQMKVSLIRDVDDNKFLELAETCNADFIITANTNDFTMKSYKHTKIVTPKEYWENHLP